MLQDVEQLQADIKALLADLAALEARTPHHVWRASMMDVVRFAQDRLNEGVVANAERMGSNTTGRVT